MATRRMFSIRITESGSVFRLPFSAQALYFHLGMQADDDGVVDAFNILRLMACSEDDLHLLEEKGYIKILNDDLLVYIFDWKENNQIRLDRKVDSLYQDLVRQQIPDVEFSKSKDSANQNEEPQSLENTEDNQASTKCQPNDNQVTTKCQPSDNQMSAQDRVVEVSSVKDSLDQFRSEEVVPKEPQQPQEKVTSFVNYQSFVDEYHQRCPSLRKIKALTPGRRQRLKALLAKYTVDQILLVFDKAQASALLRGECSGKGYENFIAGFDWIINEDNFVKILEGKYDSRSRPSYLDRPGIYESLEPLLLEN